MVKACRYIFHSITQEPGEVILPACPWTRKQCKEQPLIHTKSPSK